MTIILPTVDLPHSLRPLRESYRFGCTKKQLIICKSLQKKKKKRFKLITYQGQRKVYSRMIIYSR